jgi:SAM-dependent methyltransferase
LLQNAVLPFVRDQSLLDLDVTAHSITFEALMTHRVADSAAQLGQQLARLTRALIETESDTRPVAGSLKPPFGNSDLNDWQRSVELWREHGRELIAQQPVRTCPACAEGGYRSLFFSFDDYPYVECLTCGTWYIPHHVGDPLFDEYYKRCPEAYQIVERFAEQRLQGVSADADRERMTRYFAELEPLFEHGPRNFLDVGCGVGHSLDIAADRGWLPTGVETSAAILEAGRQRQRRMFHPDKMNWDDKFQLVGLWETLEHLNDPMGVLSSITAALDDEGVLSITVPNLQALETRLMRQDLSWINGGAGFGTVHINLFSPSSLAHLLRRVGLEIVGWDGEYGFDAYELASYALGRHRGAWDYSRGHVVDHGLGADAIAVVNWVAPAWQVLSRQLLFTPILKVIATRSRQPEHLARLRAIHAANRRAAMLAALEGSYPGAQVD